MVFRASPLAAPAASGSWKVMLDCGRLARGLTALCCSSGAEPSFSARGICWRACALCACWAAGRLLPRSIALWRAVVDLRRQHCCITATGVSTAVLNLQLDGFLTARFKNLNLVLEYYMYVQVQQLVQL